MYLELLKQLYYKERKKLESMWIYKQDSKLRFLQLRKIIAEKVKGRLTISELLGRADIAEDVKDNLLRNRENEDKVKERLDKNIDDELSSIDIEEKEELLKADYPPDEYADYLLQSEKVAVLEDTLSEERLFPDQVYEEQQIHSEKETGKTS